MEISGQRRFQELANLFGVQESHRSSLKSRVHTGGPHDQIEISEHGQELQRIRTLVEQADTNGAERIADIRKAIETGSYNVSGQAVADAMLRHALTDAVL